MRKHILILMLVLPLLLMSCVKNNKPTEDVLSEKIISETPESADEYIYINSDTGFPVFIPPNWTGKYSIEHQENGFTLYHKATYEVNPDIGMLFRVQKRDGTVPDEWITENPGGAAYFQGDDYYIAFIVPTDVQYSEGTSEEYIELAEQIDEIRRGIAVSMKDAGINEYEDILTFPASSIADIPETAPAPRPAGLEEEAYRFILWHHYYNTVLNNDELKPQVDTFYAIYETYLLEIAIGTKFDGDVETWLIPVEVVKNTISYLYDLDGNSVQYDEFPIDKDNPDYFRYPVRSPSPVWAFIQWETLTINDSMCKFNVIFYDAPLDDSDRGEELRTFTYEFEQVLYKDSSPSKTVCYKFIGATRVK